MRRPPHDPRRDDEPDEDPDRVPTKRIKLHEIGGTPLPTKVRPNPVRPRYSSTPPWLLNLSANDGEKFMQELFKAWTEIERIKKSQEQIRAAQEELAEHYNAFRAMVDKKTKQVIATGLSIVLSVIGSAVTITIKTSQDIGAYRERVDTLVRYADKLDERMERLIMMQAERRGR